MRNIREVCDKCIHWRPPVEWNGVKFPSGCSVINGVWEEDDYCSRWEARDPMWYGQVYDVSVCDDCQYYQMAIEGDDE